MAGLGVGGGFTRGDPPPTTAADGFHGRLTTGVGWGTPHVVGQVLGDLEVVGSHDMVGVALELGVVPVPGELPPPEDERERGSLGIALLGRAGYGAGEDELRAVELSVGGGFAGWFPEYGPFVAGVYVTSYRLDAPGAAVSWSHGLILAFTVPLAALYDQYQRKKRGGR